MTQQWKKIKLNDIAEIIGGENSSSLKTTNLILLIMM